MLQNPRDTKVEYSSSRMQKAADHLQKAISALLEAKELMYKKKGSWSELQGVIEQLKVQDVCR